MYYRVQTPNGFLFDLTSRFKFQISLDLVDCKARKSSSTDHRQRFFSCSLGPRSVPLFLTVFLLENKKCGRQQIGTPWWKVHLANNLLFDHLVFSAFAHVRTERELIMHPSFFCSCSSMNRTLQQQIDQHTVVKTVLQTHVFKKNHR